MSELMPHVAQGGPIGRSETMLRCNRSSNKFTYHVGPNGVFLRSAVLLAAGHACGSNDL